jgi:8-oxo-dGTP diphosphatase
MISHSDQGISNDRYTIIPRVLIFVFSGKWVLLLKGAPNKRLWSNLYNGIGGHIDRGEDILSAANRELKEEAGLDGIPLYLCGTVIVDTSPKTGVGIFVFRGEYSGSALISSSEGQLEWIDPDRLDKIPLVEDLFTILPLVKNWEPGMPLFSANYFYDENDRLIIKIS